MKIEIENKCALQWLKEQPDFSADLIYCDPPYALGSEIIIKPDGKPDYKKAVDFMAKWEMPDGEFWEQFYKEANRVLKHGGHLLMFGVPRQNMLFKYYANFAGFQSKQSLIWYTISGFPKASDLEKNILKTIENELKKIENTDVVWE
jgi:DNA modification methylase